jgi:hypothetical protein
MTLSSSTVQPTAACIDSYTLQSTPESDTRAGYDGAKRRKGSKIHIAVDTLGHLLALLVPGRSGRSRSGRGAGPDMQQVTGGTVEMAYFAQAVLVRNLRLSQRRTGSS